jgi:predicted RNase H-like HicB family nuclease
MARPKKEAQPAQRIRKYSVYFVPDEDAGGFTAHIPALGIVTEGETLRDAHEMAKDAVEGWIEAARELGKPIPADVATALVEVSA